MSEADKTDPASERAGCHDADAEASAVSTTTQPTTGKLVGNLALFTLARLAIVVVLVAIIEGLGYLILRSPVPLLVAALIAVILAMPLSAVLLRRWSLKINADIAAVDAGRRERREELRRRMQQ